MKLALEVKTERLGPNRYHVAALRPDGTEYFCFGGLWSSSAAQQKAEDYLRSVNPKAKIEWDSPGEEAVGQVLYRGSTSIPGDSQETPATQN
jgi:hypothetical protein